jgi:uracil-DNA glycosylase
MADAKGTPVTVKGWVLDSACAYTKGLEKPISRDCALACAKKGSPLVILRDDGTIFLPIAAETPAAGQNEKLLPFAGKRVAATGRSFTRAGSQALVIDKVEAEK